MNKLTEKTTEELIARRDEIKRALSANRKYLASVLHEISLLEKERQLKENAEMAELVAVYTELLYTRDDYTPF